MFDVFWQHLKKRAIFEFTLLKEARNNRWSYSMLRRLASRLYPAYNIGEFGRIHLEDLQFKDRIAPVDHLVMFAIYDRRYFLDQLVKAAVRLEGDTAECGVFRGGASYIICKRIEGLDKTHHVFDSFAGLSPLMDVDGTDFKEGDFAVNEETVKKNLSNFDFIKYYKGWIPTRFNEVENRRFCLVHIDVDNFSPTRESLEFFYPRMVEGGLIVIDDYGFNQTPGARKAVDEFLLDKRETVICATTGQGFIIKMK